MGFLRLTTDDYLLLVDDASYLILSDLFGRYRQRYGLLLGVY